MEKKSVDKEGTEYMPIYVVQNGFMYWIWFLCSISVRRKKTFFGLASVHSCSKFASESIQVLKFCVVKDNDHLDFSYIIKVYNSLIFQAEIIITDYFVPKLKGT